jgi:uncharacterized protein YbjT (DUF2867 family)
MSKPIIAVTGATGAQGGGLVRALLADPAAPFAVRAITRNPDSDKARALAAAGAEVARADIDDVASLTEAFAGAHGAFCLTNFWEHFSGPRETVQGKNLAQAAKNAGVKHAVWSTFEDTRLKYPLDDARMPTLHGIYKVPHFDSKADANAAFIELGVPTTFLVTSFYWDNFVAFGMGPKRGPDGKLALVLPMGDAKLPGIVGTDIGGCAYGVFKRPELIGMTVGVAGEHLTGAEMAAGMSRALGEEVAYTPVPPAVYRSFGFPGADDLGNMFQFKHDYEAEYCGARDVAFSRGLFAGLQNFEQWLAANKDKLAVG